MKYTVSMKKNHEFKRLYNKGKSQVNPFLAVYVRRNNQKKNVLGITVGVKLGNAVTRNKVRRRIREIYRTHEHLLLSGFHIVIVARNRCANASYQQILHSFCSLADNLQLSAQPLSSIYHLKPKNISQKSSKKSPNSSSHPPSRSSSHPSPHATSHKSNPQKQKQPNVQKNPLSP